MRVDNTVLYVDFVMAICMLGGVVKFNLDSIERRYSTMSSSE